MLAGDSLPTIVRKPSDLRNEKHDPKGRGWHLHVAIYLHGDHPAMLSIAICTFDRAASLRTALTCLADALATIPVTAYELLVVDNNSSDSTPQVCAEFSDRIELRYLFEARQGLSVARNRVLEECRGNWLLFTDDDVFVEPHWVNEYLDAIRCFPNAAFLAGRIHPRWPGRRPSWLHDETLDLLSGVLVRYDLGEENRVLEANDPLPFGASFAVSRPLFESVGKFSTDLGVVGKSLGRGEEADYIQRALVAGFSGAYCGRALCFHAADMARFTASYLYRYGIESAIAYRLTAVAPSPGSLWKEYSFAIRGLLQLLRGRGDRFRQCVINMGIQRGLRTTRQICAADNKNSVR